MDNFYDQPNGENQNPKKNGGHKAITIISVILVVALIVTGVYFGVTYYSNTLGGNHNTTIAQVDTAAAATEAQSSTAGAEAQSTSNTEETTKLVTTGSASPIVYDLSAIVEAVMPSVVAITDNLEITQSGSYNPYSYYYGGSSGQTQESVASGSGVIYDQNDTELLIVTNNHVVDNSGQTTSYTVESTGLSVAFSDGTMADAYVKGTDSDMDLAVIAVKLSYISDDTKNVIRIATIGDSDTAKVGSGVIAIGNALGYGQSVTDGIISAKDRPVTIDNITRSLLQTNAAINPGNSGGGLFNMSGELIGINSAKYSDTDVEGIGYAIPISAATEIIDELKNKEVIAAEDQGYLGVNGETVPDTYVSSYGYPAGVSITRISENSPAEAAGLQIYDIVTAVNGKAVASMAEMKEEVNSYAAGTTITLSISRPEGRSFREEEITVTLVRYSDLTNTTSQSTQEDSTEVETTREQESEQETTTEETTQSSQGGNRFGR